MFEWLCTFNGAVIPAFTCVFFFGCSYFFMWLHDVDWTASERTWAHRNAAGLFFLGLFSFAFGCFSLLMILLVYPNDMGPAAERSKEYEVRLKLEAKAEKGPPSTWHGDTTNQTPKSVRQKRLNRYKQPL